MNKNHDLIYQLNNISNTYIDRNGRVISNNNQYGQKNLGNFIEIVPLKLNEGLIIEEPKLLPNINTIRNPNKNIRIKAKNIQKECKNYLQDELKDFHYNNNNLSNRINKYLSIINHSKRSSTADSSDKKHLYNNINMNYTITNQMFNKFNSNLKTIDEIDINKKSNRKNIKNIKNNTVNNTEEQKRNTLLQINNEFQEEIFKKSNK